MPTSDNSGGERQRVRDHVRKVLRHLSARERNNTFESGRAEKRRVVKHNGKKNQPGGVVDDV
jgi:hypothetical protein